MSASPSPQNLVTVATVNFSPVFGDAKATLDKNLDALLAMANIPSRADYQKMQAKLDSLQGSVMSLSRTVEKLRETLTDGNGNGNVKGSSRPTTKRATATKPRARTSSTKSRSTKTTR